MLVLLPSHILTEPSSPISRCGVVPLLSTLSTKLGYADIASLISTDVNAGMQRKDYIVHRNQTSIRSDL